MPKASGAPSLPTKSGSRAKAATLGAPKPKGAVRAKSGCYTCRIRRKKCDEGKEHSKGTGKHESCSTCERLRLQCLGYGVKRPDWLRAPGTIEKVREAIKQHLEQHGLIKGHSGVGQRQSSPSTPPQKLILEPASNGQDSDSATSPSTASICLDDDHNLPVRITISNVRDDEPLPSYLHQPHPALSPDSPTSSPRQRTDLMLAEPATPTTYDLSAHTDITHDHDHNHGHHHHPRSSSSSSASSSHSFSNTPGSEDMFSPTSTTVTSPPPLAAAHDRHHHHHAHPIISRGSSPRSWASSSSSSRPTTCSPATPIASSSFPDPSDADEPNDYCGGISGAYKAREQQRNSMNVVNKTTNNGGNSYLGAPISGSDNGIMQPGAHLPSSVSLHHGYLQPRQQFQRTGLSMPPGLHSPPVHPSSISGANTIPIVPMLPFQEAQAPVTVPLPCGQQHQDGDHSDAQQTLMTGANNVSLLDATVTELPNSGLGGMSRTSAGQYQNGYGAPVVSMFGSGSVGMAYRAPGWQAQTGAMTLARYGSIFEGPSLPFTYGTNGSMSRMMQQQQYMPSYGQFPTSPFSSPPLLSLYKDPSVDHEAHSLAMYEHSVVHIQYLLADANVVKVIESTLKKSQTAREAVLVLSSIYRNHMSNASDLSIARQEHVSTIVRAAMDDFNFDEGIAMAAIQLISAALFDGGTTQWEHLLQYAAMYTFSILHYQQSQQYYYGGMALSPQLQALVDTSAANRFLCKISIWFDTLAAPSRHYCQPTLARVVDAMYNPDVYPSSSLLAGVYAASSGSGSEDIIGDSYSDLYECTSMMNVMGCDSRVVWALSRISSLLALKESGNPMFEQNKEMVRTSVLSVLDNVVRDEDDIESHQVTPYSDVKYIDRQHTARIFRHAAHVYLLAVVDGAYPTSPKIRAAVIEVRNALLRARERDAGDSMHQPRQRRTIYPSVVFAIFLSGALTEDEEQRQFFRECLQVDGEQPYAHPFSFPGANRNKRQVGNCAQVLRVLETLWANRRTGSSDPVPWRKHLLDENLLLV